MENKPLFPSLGICLRYPGTVQHSFTIRKKQFIILETIKKDQRIATEILMCVQVKRQEICLFNPAGGQGVLSHPNHL
ncbi:hypothetical protein CEXT_771111 [Caerostris extrusa]|uniref:Uncharacterized protein n=1 Tax=Caerostris extrusa TaxID=172846 RepID=A0AAV4PPB6_CAEEX|nr:hypothetical protein CEXT_771111 [Caerostris extrusa]